LDKVTPQQYAAEDQRLKSSFSASPNDKGLNIPQTSFGERSPEETRAKTPDRLK
jgi:hypothetical protein